MKETEILKEKASHFSGLAYDYKQACRELLDIIDLCTIPTSVADKVTAKYLKVGEALARLADKHNAFNEWLEDNTDGVIPLHW